MQRFLFPAWINTLLPVAAGVAGVGAMYFVGVVAYAVHPITTDVGYKPVQPVPFSHALHAGTLKMDCRYCHNTVESTAHAAIPAAQTCGNCHSAGVDGAPPATVAVHSDSAKLAPIRLALQKGESVPWRKVHDLADYVYFNHSVHVNRGVSCVSCHGRIDTMDVVQQSKTLSMGFCLQCHRNPTPSIRPVAEVTNLGWQTEDPEKLGAELAVKLGIHPKDNCSTCHR